MSTKMTKRGRQNWAGTSGIGLTAEGAVETASEGEVDGPRGAAGVPLADLVALIARLFQNIRNGAHANMNA